MRNKQRCEDSLTHDCDKKDGCSNNLYDSYSFTGYSLQTYGCTKTSSCKDSCCPTGQKCDGGVCKVPIPCKDNDGDGYNGKTSDCSTGTDCNDANANIHPGATEHCGNGVDEDCSGSDASCADV